MVVFVLHLQVARGVSLALEGADRECCRDCAGLLEALKQWGDAAKLYVAAEQHDKAAAIYIKTKNWGVRRLQVPPAFRL